MLCYKAATSDGTRVVITLEVPPDAKTTFGRRSVVNRNFAHYRISKGYVVSITDDAGVSYQTACSAFYPIKRTYTVGQLIEEWNYCDDINTIYAEGIHVFLTKWPAELFGLTTLQNGLLVEWEFDGRVRSACPFQDGEIHGTRKCWIRFEQQTEYTPFERGLIHGTIHEWRMNSHTRTTEYHQGYRTGHEQYHYSNGVKEIESTSLTDGVRTRIHCIYASNGQLVSRVTYTNGQLCKTEHWYENGSPERVVIHGTRYPLYILGSLEDTRWDEDGTLLVQCVWSREDTNMKYFTGTFDTMLQKKVMKELRLLEKLT